MFYVVNMALGLKKWEIFVCYNWKFVITHFIINNFDTTELVKTEFDITKFVTTEFVKVKFDCNKIDGHYLPDWLDRR
jgi:hypothetical protein